jgi:two-component system response regulator YesN
LFDVLDIEGASSEISKVFDEADKRSSENIIIYHLTANEIIEMLFAAIQKKGIGIKSGLSKEQAVQYVDDCLKKSDIEGFIHELLKECGNVYMDEKHDSGEKLITEIKKFISENYVSNISLDDIAKLVCLSPTYVSEIFKRKTGENFSEYLIDYRIEIAKDVLKDIRYKVVDVSLMVGYSDSKYFGRLFKKKVGVNPSDYRKLYL